MSKRRSWLDRISGWILDVLPAEKEPLKRSTRRDLSPEGRKSQPRSQKKASTEKTQVPKGEVAKKSWKKFINKWKELGYDENAFANEDEVLEILETLEKGFKDDLIESLYRLETNLKACKSLKDILIRGKVSASDDLTAVRSYAYIGILASTRHRHEETNRKTNKQDSEPKATTETEDEREIKISEFSETTKPPIRKEDQISDREQDLLEIDLKELDTRILTLNSLYRSGYNKIGDLAGLEREDLLKLKNFGIKSLNDLEQQLAKYELSIPIKIKERFQFIKEEEESKVAEEKREEETFDSWRRMVAEAFKGNNLEGKKYSEVFEELTSPTPLGSDSTIEASLLTINSIFAALSTGIDTENSNTSEVAEQVKLESLKNLILNSENKGDFISKVTKLRKLNKTSAYRDFNLFVGRIIGKTYAELAKNKTLKSPGNVSVRQ